MRGTLMYGPGDVRVEDVPEPSIVERTDAIIRIVRACVCGSDLWPCVNRIPMGALGSQAELLRVPLADGTLVAHRGGGKVFDLELPLDEAAAGYQAMDERRAIKVLLHP
jgi:threonine dehydrogenase-like Zn-dependent dehydrogenase